MPGISLTAEQAQALRQKMSGPVRLTAEQADRVRLQKILEGQGASAPIPESRRVYPVDTREPAPSVGIGGRILGRLTGNDVNDPLSLERAGGVTAGAIGGAMLGSRVPPMGPINPLTGAAAGGALGAVAGAVAPEATRATFKKFGVLPQSAESGLSGPDLRRVAEGEALLDLATGGALQVARLAGRGVAGAITRPGKEGRATAAAAAAQGIDMTPVQAGKGGQGIINVLGRFPLIGGTARKMGGQAEKQLITALGEVPNRVGPLLGETELGLRIYGESRNLFKSFHDDIGARYNAVFADAEKAGVSILPQGTLDAAGQALADITKKAPVSGEGTPLSAGETLDKVRDFLEREIAPMQAEQGAAPQTLRQMDGLLSKIDQKIASFPVDERKVATKALAPLREAVKADVATHAVGDGAKEISQRLAELDGEFTTTMRYLFETSVAKKFGAVRRQGLKGVVRASDEATRTPEDQLARLVINTKSPQAVDELFRLVEKDTRSAIAANVIDKAVGGAINVSEGVQQVNAAALRKNLGLDNPRGPTFSAMQRVLRESGVTMKDMQALTEAAAAMQRSPVPNASTFLARGAAMGGKEALAGALTGGLLTGAGAAAGGGVGALLGAVLFMGGGRLLTSIISNPLNAKPFFKSLDKEASVQVRRQSYLRATRLGLIALAQDDGATPSEAVRRADAVMGEMRKVVGAAVTNRLDN